MPPISPKAVRPWLRRRWRGSCRMPGRCWVGLVWMAIACHIPLAAAIAQGSPLITAVRFDGPTDRYNHGVLGDAIEHTTLVLTLQTGEERRFTLPENMVFEDTSPRLADVTGDGHPEVITVESSQTEGARLAVYSATGRLATTAHIGQRNRWLAPVGAADIDGDGQIEIAYVDRPHLIQTLRLVRLEAGKLVETASLRGVTNHRIGWNYILGGIRTCTGRPEIILSTGDFLANLSVFWAKDQRLDTRAQGNFDGPKSIERLLACKD